jgi:hypothetical protein
MTACSNEAELLPEPTPSASDSLVEIVIDLPTCYGYVGTARTRADGDNAETSSSESTTTTERRFLNNDGKECTAQFLDIGQTIWLTYRNVTDGTTNAEEVTKPYVVRGYADTRSLFACGTRDSVDEEGHKWLLPNSEESESPLYLPVGTYNFRVMAPALPILREEGETNYCSVIENGVYFSASDERYANTKGFDQKVTSDNTGAGVLRIALNPMVWQVARLKFTIAKDKDSPSFDLGVLPAGIEISGLQHPYTEDGKHTYFNWRSGTDTIPMKRGDKSEWVRIQGEDCTLSGDTIYADVAVLPTNAMSTTIVILFNLTINGVPTQFETHIDQKILQHGHSYGMNVRVSLSTGISAMTWYNDSWTTEQAFITRRITP